VSGVIKKKPDYRKLAHDRIKKAVKSYNSGKKKEAYTMVSEAVRFYIRFKYAPNEEELTSTDALKVLRGCSVGDKYISESKRCFQLCDLVKFAKYKPNDKDFNKIVVIAKKLVV